MEQINYILLRDAFFNSYKAYIDFLRLTNKGNDMYHILILRKPLNCDLVNLNIIINGICANDENYNYCFKNNVILNYAEAKVLVDMIRTDFRDNHYIAFCTVCPNDSIQRLQNTNYSLNIRLLDIEEQKEAITFNDKINNDLERHKALIKK